MNLKKMKYDLVFAAFSVAVLAASAATEQVEIPKWTGGGNPDLANPATYGLDAVPTGKWLVFDHSKVAGSTFVTSDDVSFSGFYFTLLGADVVTFDINPARTITLGSDGLKCFPNASNHQNVILTGGGTLDMGNGSLYAGCVNYVSANNSLVVSGGTTVKNALEVKVSYGATGNALQLDGGSKLTSTWFVPFENYSSIIAESNRLEIAGGSSIEWTPTATSSTIMHGKGNLLRVTGEGSLLQDTSRKIAIISGEDNVVRVEDKATATVGALYFGYSAGAAGNRLEVDSGSTMTVDGQIRINAGDGAQANDVFVGAGATLNAEGGYFQLEGDGHSTVTVSNGTFNTWNFKMLSGHNVIRLVGADAVWNTPTFSKAFNVFGTESWQFNTFVLDGAKVEKYLSFGDSGLSYSDCELDIVNGGEITTGGFNFGGKVGTTDRNVLCVANGGKLTSGAESWISAADNTLLLSNGTVSVSGKLRVGQNNGSVDANANTNDAIVIRGSSSELAVTGELDLQHGARLCFELPQEGLAKVPVTIGSASISDDTVLSIDCSKVERNLSSRNFVLIESGEEMTWPASALAEVNAELQQIDRGYRVCLTADGKKLMLRIPGNGGLGITIR